MEMINIAVEFIEVPTTFLCVIDGIVQHCNPDIDLPPNIGTSEVPIPTSFVMFASSLLCLLGFR